MRSIRNNIGGLGNLLFKEAYIYAQFRKGHIPDIYVQDEAYFVEYRDELRIRWGENIGFENQLDFTAIHVRRGDYVGSNFHANLSETDYYKRATALIPEKKFLVFSDDIEWCKEYFRPCEGEFTFVEKTEMEEFNMMASCRNIIMANSTFSWWAAYLGYARVIAPKEETWFTDSIIRIRLPKNYEQI